VNHIFIPFLLKPFYINPQKILPKGSSEGSHYFHLRVQEPEIQKGRISDMGRVNSAR
jgi:hypothetical protein